MMPHDPVRNHPSVAEALSKARRVLARGQSAIVPLPLPLLLLLLVFFAMPARADHAALATPVPPLPQRLHDTGLYVDGAPGLLVRADNLPYAPQYPLWTDGARKRRWIHLPPGSWIDASDPDAWQFPIGTRLWKEFAHAGRPIETRFIERLPDGRWRFATYVWNQQGSDATLAPERGIRRLPASDAPGGVYAVPGRNDCRACHEASVAPVLGFSALQLSPDRDPHALHAEPASQHLVDLRSLQSRGLLRGLPATAIAQAPRIAAATALARSALGYLHGNCGHCHNDVGPLASLDMAMLQSVGDPVRSARRTWASLYGQGSRFHSERGDRSEPAPPQRIAPGRVDDSTVLLRMASPHTMSRMPPIGVSVVDAAGLQLVRQWILSLDFSHRKEIAP